MIQANLEYVRLWTNYKISVPDAPHRVKVPKTKSQKVKVKRIR